VRRRRLTDRADRPVGRYPFAGGVDEGGSKPDQPAIPIDGGRLHGCDLVLAEAFADQIEAGGEWGVAEAPAAHAGERGDDGGGQGFFRICDLGLGLGKRRRKCPNPIAGVLHARPPLREPQN
jgi:hypothetical protein